MIFTIRGILAATLLAAIGLHAVSRWHRISVIQEEIDAAQTEIARQMFDPAYVAGNTAVCRGALENNPIPSPYFVAAKAKHDRLFAEEKAD